MAKSSMWVLPRFCRERGVMHENVLKEGGVCVKTSSSKEVQHENVASCGRFGLSDSAEQRLRRDVKRFRGGLLFKAHRLLYHSNLGVRVIKKKKKKIPRARAGHLELVEAADQHAPLVRPFSCVPVQMRPFRCVHVRPFRCVHVRPFRCVPIQIQMRPACPALIRGNLFFFHLMAIQITTQTL